MYHLLIECSTSLNVWEWVFQFLSENAGIQISFSKCELILGVIECAESAIFNLLFTITKQYIYACRCLEQTPQKVSLNAKIEEVKCMEKRIAESNNNMRQYNDKWKILK